MIIIPVNFSITAFRLFLLIVFTSAQKLPIQVVIDQKANITEKPFYNWNR